LRPAPNRPIKAPRAAFVSAALVAHLQGKSPGIIAWQLDVNDAVIHLHIAEEFVMLGLALRDDRRAQNNVGRLGSKHETVAVQVIAVGGHQAQLDGMGVGLDQAELEGFVYREEVGIAGQ